MTRRFTALTALMLVVCLVGAGVGGVAAADPSGVTADQFAVGDQVSEPPDDPVSNQTDDSGEGNTSAESSDSEQPDDTATPSMSETVRISAVDTASEVGSATARDSSNGTAFNTIGEFVVLRVSEPLDAARIQQSPASVEMLGPQSVMVEYESDAAPLDEESLYTLELFYTDGSDSQVDLYASDTDITVGSDVMEDMRPVILDIMDRAEDAGYEDSATGLQNYVEDTEETAELLDSVFSEQAARLAQIGLMAAMNPLFWVIVVSGAALLAVRSYRRDGRIHRLISQDTGQDTRLLREAWLQWQSDRQTAAEEPLSELQAVGQMGEIYWRDTYGVSSVADLAEISHNGIPIENEHGDVNHVGGIEELQEADDLMETWLEPVCRESRVAAPEIALAHLKSALTRMCSDHGMSHRYRATREDVRRLIEQRDGSTASSEFDTDGGSK